MRLPLFQKKISRMAYIRSMKTTVQKQVKQQDHEEDEEKDENEPSVRPRRNRRVVSRVAGMAPIAKSRVRRSHAAATGRRAPASAPLSTVAAADSKSSGARRTVAGFTCPFHATCGKRFSLCSRRTIRRHVMDCALESALLRHIPPADATYRPFIKCHSQAFFVAVICRVRGASLIRLFLAAACVCCMCHRQRRCATSC